MYLLMMYGRKSDMSVMVGTINVEEITDATTHIVLLVQAEAFSDETEYGDARWEIKKCKRASPYFTLQPLGHRINYPTLS